MPSWRCSRSTSSRFPRSTRRMRPRVVALGNLFRDQLDRYGELEHIAERWRASVTTLSATLPARRQRRRSPGGSSRRRTATGRCASASTTRARAAPAPACGGLEVLRPLRQPVRVCRGLRGPPRRLPLPRLRPREAAARRRGEADRPPWARRHRLRSRHPGRHCARPAAAARSLQRLQRAGGGRHGARARRLARRDRQRPRGVQCRLRPLRAHRGQATARS